MRKGLIGAFQLGALSALSEALVIAQRVTGQTGVDLEEIFYASSFQAGIDEFLVADIESMPGPRSTFVLDRTRRLSKEKSRQSYDLISSALSRHLPHGWERNDQYSAVWGMQAFLVDLFDAMGTGASVLSPWGIPDIAETRELLPSEFAVLLSNLLGGIQILTSASPIPQRFVQRDDLERFNQILTSDLFGEYVSRQAQLDDANCSVSATLQDIAIAGRKVFSKYPRLLTLKNTCLGVLQITPKIIDAAFGKLPGALAEMGARLGLSLLESRKRIVIYDFQSTVEEIFLANLVRMFKASERKGGTE
jgi:hypothetical protein